MENLTFVQALLTLATVLAVVTSAGLFVAKYRMGKIQARLAKQQIAPAGATLAHGMAFRENRRGVVSCSEPSLAWYKRLF